MTEALEQLDATPEVIAPEPEQPSVPVAEAAPEANQPEPPKQEEPNEIHWKAARASLKQKTEQARLLEQQNLLLQQELELLRRQNPAPKKEEEEDLELLTESEKKLYRKIQALDQKLKQKEAKENDYVTDRLKARYPDFDEVVSSENIEYLKTNNAALAKALQSLKDDPYEQGLAAYDALKNTAWYQQRQTMQDKAKVEANAKKPMSVQAVRKQGPLSEANKFVNGLTPELKKQLQREMAEARKGA